jgi:hypothetical protein
VILAAGRGEQQIDFAAKAEILRALSDVERELSFPLTGIARVELQKAVFQFQARKARPHGLLVEHLDVQKTAGNQSFGTAGEPARIRTIGGQNRRDIGFVLHFDQERAPALLDQLGLGRPFLHFDAAFWIDIHEHQTMAVENALHLGDGLQAVGRRAG